jgi:guanidinoacetate N-methyltransferase
VREGRARQAEQYDGILFDTYQMSRDERGRNHFPFIPVAPRLLRQGGRLTLYSDETEKFRTEHLALLLASFRDVRLVRVDGLQPPPECEYWQHEAMIMPVATKTN